MVNNKKDQIKNLINSGSELAGGAIGGALGFFAAGPIGAGAFGAGGVLISKTLSYIGNELSLRFLGPREEIRVGATLAIAAKKINERLEKGDIIRSDDFFDMNSSGRSKAEEIAESVLLKSQKEAEEKKIPFLANLLVNISFSSEISVELGQQMIKTVDSLTYRQLCILSLAVNKWREQLRKTNYHEHKAFERDLYQILHECIDLYNRAFIKFGNTAILGLTDMNPSTIAIQGLGVDIYNWAQLNEIPFSDIEPIVNVLSK